MQEQHAELEKTGQNITRATKRRQSKNWREVIHNQKHGQDATSFAAEWSSTMKMTFRYTVVITKHGKRPLSRKPELLILLLLVYYHYFLHNRHVLAYFATFVAGQLFVAVVVLFLVLLSFLSCRAPCLNQPTHPHYNITQSCICKFR